MGETWNMNKKEIDRYEIIQRVINKQITQIKAAELLKISPRRLRKLQRRVETYGPQGVISRSRGQPGNRRKPQPCAMGGRRSGFEEVEFSDTFEKC